ncbi:hypothetical protein AAFF_G00342140 [Aldrovandia affinis]|uniref:Uncharacterized protein n=1 Tax=Aldrovandia affinis TaxID=143900 RepID=A0AAD7R665_9TELE|nr:hypothetical protein AAFF_G00342140 [Aldrovandia affinis]
MHLQMDTAGGRQRGDSRIAEDNTKSPLCVEAVNVRCPAPPPDTGSPLYLPWLHYGGRRFQRRSAFRAAY